MRFKEILKAIFKTLGIAFVFFLGALLGSKYQNEKMYDGITRIIMLLLLVLFRMLCPKD